MGEPDEVEEKPTPILFEHCRTVYNAMWNEAKVEPREEDDGNDLVYEGHLTKLIAAAGLSTPMYTSVRRALISMGCIDQIRRGGGNAKSRWLLIGEPNEEDFRDMELLRTPVKGRIGVLEQRLREVNARLQLVEQALEIHR